MKYFIYFASLAIFYVVITYFILQVPYFITMFMLIVFFLVLYGIILVYLFMTTKIISQPTADQITDEHDIDLFNYVQFPNFAPIDKIFNYFYIKKPGLIQTERIQLIIQEYFEQKKIFLNFLQVRNSLNFTSFCFEMDALINVSEKVLHGMISGLELALGIYGLTINTKTGEENVICINVPFLNNQRIGILNALEDENFGEFLMDHYQLNKNALMILPIVFGIKQDGSLAFTDLHKQPSILIGGSSGSGKSTLLHSILNILLTYHKPQTLQLYMVDTKIVELNKYEKFPHVKQIIYEHDKLQSLTDQLNQIMQERYKMFSQKKCKDILEYNEQVQSTLPFIVLILEELGDLMSYNTNVSLDLVRILQKGRAAGIHVIAATQRPSTDIINGSIKANLPCRVAMRVASGTDSKIIIDKVGAEELLNKGDMIVNDGGNFYYAHSLFVSKEEMQNLENYYNLINLTKL